MRKKSVRARYLVAKTDISYDLVFYAHLHDSTTKAIFTRAAEYALKRQGPYSILLEIWPKIESTITEITSVFEEYTFIIEKYTSVF